MSFYDALQMDPSVLKKKISQSNEKKEKVYYWAAITVRAILIVAFAILFITTLSNIFVFLIKYADGSSSILYFIRNTFCQL